MLTPQFLVYFHSESLRCKAAARRDPTPLHPCPFVFTFFICSLKLHGSQKGCCDSKRKAETTAFTETQGPWGKGKGAGLAVCTGHTSHVQCQRPQGGSPSDPGTHLPLRFFHVLASAPGGNLLWRAVVLQICPTNHLPLIPH